MDGDEKTVLYILACSRSASSVLQGKIASIIQKILLCKDIEVMWRGGNKQASELFKLRNDKGTDAFDCFL